MNRKSIFLLTVLLGIFSNCLFGAKIGDLGQTEFIVQAMRFIKLEDAAVRYALAGVAILGVSSGVLGSFMFVRKRSLLADTLSHAMLPGLTIAFLIFLKKDLLILFLGALGSALLGGFVVNLLKSKTRLKEDAILGIVLAGFYSIGITVLTLIQQFPISNQAGLDKFLFGQASALSLEDVYAISLVCAGSLGAIFLFYRKLLLLSFDPQFGQSIGVRCNLYDSILMLLLCMTIVVAAKAVGIILVSALLIIPAGIGRLLSKRFPIMVTIAATTGLISAILGTFVSFLNFKYPTGPFIILVAGVLFTLALILAPRHGLLYRWTRKEDRSVH